MSLEIQKTEGILNKKVSTPAQTGSTSSDNSAISFNYTSKETLDLKSSNEIKAMLYIINPKLHWEELQPAEQKKYIEEYSNGTLQKKCEDIKNGSEAAFKQLGSTLSQEEIVDAIVDSHMSRIYDNYNELKPEEKEKLKIKEGLRVLEYIKPETAKLSDEKKLQELNEMKFTITATLHHCKKEGIDISTLSKEQIEKFATDPAKQEGVRFELEKEMIKANPSILKGETVTDAAIAHDYNLNVLNREIADKYAEKGITIEQILNNKVDVEALTLEYLRDKAKTNDLSEFEQAKLDELEAQNKKFGNLRGVRNGNNSANFEQDFIYQYLKDKNNNQKINLSKLTDEEKADIQNALIDKIKSFENEDEKAAFIKKVYTNTKGKYALDIYQSAFTQLVNDGVLSLDELNQIRKDAEAQGGPSIHTSYEHAGKLKAASMQVKMHDAYINDEKVNEEQVAAGTLNVAAETFHEEAKAPAVKMSIDRAPSQMTETLPDINKKLSADSSKEVTEYITQTNSLTVEQKAQIFRDIIDTTKDADLKKYYEDLASKNNID